jgi:hypothetical protein
MTAALSTLMIIDVRTDCRQEDMRKRRFAKAGVERA